MAAGTVILRRIARRVAADERGFTMAAVLLMMVAAMATVTVAVTASINAQHGTVRDQDTKAALVAAEAGVTQALLVYNGGFTTTESAPCLTPVTNPPNTVQPRTTQLSGTDSWCAPVTGSSGGGSFTYQVCPATTTHPCAGKGTLEIVASGTVNGVQRRVDVVAKSANGSQVFLDAGVKSQTDIVMDSNAEIHSSSSAGRNIILGSTSTKLCGSATVGPDGTASGSGIYTASETCSPPLLPLTDVGHQTVVLPPVNQGDAPTVNDNCRITGARTGVSPCPGGEKDLISGNKNNVSWDPVNRRLDLTGQSTTLTLTGTTYSFCRVTLSQNSAIYIQAGQKVNIYFDSPEACNLPAYDASTGQKQKSTAQLYMESNTRISAAGTGQALAMFFVGSRTLPTGVLLSSNSDGNAACV
jgi:Tfp pilus assembly protein PilX